jgi:hypothetical protein
MQIPKPHMTKKIAGVQRYKITETDRTPPSEFERLLNAAIANVNMAAQNLGNISSEDPRVTATQSAILQAQSTLEDLLLQQQPVQRPPNPQAAIAAYDQNKSQLGESNKMKISKDLLKQIIKEELDATMQEMYGHQDHMDEDYMEEELGYGDTQHLAEEDFHSQPTEPPETKSAMIDYRSLQSAARKLGKTTAQLAAILGLSMASFGGGYVAGEKIAATVSDELETDDLERVDVMASQFTGMSQADGSTVTPEEARRAALSVSYDRLPSRYDRSNAMHDKLQIIDPETKKEIPYNLREGKRTKDRLTKMIMEELQKLSKA